MEIYYNCLNILFKMFTKILIIPKFLRDHVFLNSSDKKFISFNKKKWAENSKKSNKSNEGIILIDLFYWFPWVYFWSHIVNFLIKRFNLRAKFFYFDLYGGGGSNFRIYIRKLTKLYNSFNVEEGITEYDFIYTKEEKNNYKKLFLKYVKNKRKLISFKKNNILIGDLIYDTYLRITLKPTVRLNDPLLRKIFFRSLKILKETQKYFKDNKIRYVMPSHVCYITYGIISRVATTKNIPIIKIKSENRGNSLFGLHKVSTKYCVDEPPYWDYQKIFKTFPVNEKQKFLNIGKKILKKRTSGNYDKNLPYMKGDQFSKGTKKIRFDKEKKSIIIFPHCYFDNPHRYRKMVFEDYYHQVKFFLDLSKKFTMYNWYYKPHPNELHSELDVHKEILKNYKNINYLFKSTSHYDILKLNPQCIITNHGTIAHEYASFKIPVINTGDNPHINYNFCIHAKNKRHLNIIMQNLTTSIEKIDFDKKKIYEYLFLHYDYFRNFNNERKYLKDNYFSLKNIKENNDPKILEYFIKKGNQNDYKITKYLELFFKREIDKKILKS